MTSLAGSFLAILLALTPGCTKATSTNDQGVAPQPKPQPQTVGDVTVEIAGVTLGDDCGPSATPPPPPAAVTPAKRAPGSPPATQAPGAVQESARYRCQQTSVQLAVHAGDLPAATPVTIKKVELLDAEGKVLEPLAASSPMRWSEKGAYEAWDQKIAPNEHAAVSYVLATPHWDALPGGMYGQANKQFQLRVTVAIGAKDQVIEKKAIQPTMMPPPVPT